MKLATRLLEESISYVGPRPDTRALCCPEEDSWEKEFPDLSHIADGPKKYDGVKVCIATEDIVGPIRNGGIGTTYSLLSRLLAANGFEITILYLRGSYVENETIEHWIEYYADFGVEFLPVPDFLGDKIKNPESSRWIAPMYNMYQYLKQRHFDVVHVSEWRGSGYLSLLAKDLGIGLQDTHIVVKCSSPWLWNRLYGNHTTKNPVDILKIYCEKRSVELGDHIVGGSAHLLRWMYSQGYQIADGRTFVQPNVVVVDDLLRLASQRTCKVGDRIEIDEIVFFGRLESRKGLKIFCDALDRLDGMGVDFPDVSFMGKPGARIESRMDLSVLEYIEERSKKWECHIQVHTNFQQSEAIGYLLTGNRLAVMPSLIENSSLAVYEAVICGIPFLSSNSGGTPELVKEEYHSDCLCDPHPVPLAEKLSLLLEKGGVVAECSFDNDNNNRVWLDYHRAVASGAKTGSESEDVVTPEIDVFVYYSGDAEGLNRTIASLIENRTPTVNIVIVDDVSYDSDKSVLANASLVKLLENGNCKIVETDGYDRGLAYNLAMKETDSECLVFLRESDVIKSSFFTTLYRAIKNRPQALFTTFIEKYNDQGAEVEITETEVPIIGDVPTMFYQVNTNDVFVCGRRSIFDSLGAFTGDYGVGGEVMEFLNAAALNNVETITIPEVLLERRVQSSHELGGVAGRVNRPFYKFGPQVFRNVFLAAKGQAERITVLEGKLENLRNERDRAREQRKKLHAKNLELKDRIKFGKKSTTNKKEIRSTIEESLGSIKSDSLPTAKYGSKKSSIVSILRAFEDTDSQSEINQALRSAVETSLICVNENSVCGLYVNSLSQTPVETLFLFAGDQKVGTCQTTEKPFGLSEGSQANFVFDVSGIPESDRLKAPFSVADSSGDVLLSFSYNDLEYEDVQGAIDGFNSHTGAVRGWVWSPSRPGDSVLMDVYWDEKFLLTVEADTYQAFRKKTMKNEIMSEHGLSFKIPIALIDGGSHELTLRVHRTGKVPAMCRVNIDTAKGKYERLKPETAA